MAHNTLPVLRDNRIRPIVCIHANCPLSAPISEKKRVVYLLTVSCLLDSTIALPNLYFRLKLLFHFLGYHDSSLFLVNLNP